MDPITARNLPVETELKLSVTPEMQAKFVPKSGSLDSLFGRLVGAFSFANFVIGSDRALFHTDRYFDTYLNSLEQVGHSVRVRLGDGPAMLTVKMAGSPNLGIFSREEIEREISQSELDELVRVGFEPVLSEYFHALVGEHLKEALIVETSRRECRVVRGEESYKICLDSSIFIEPRSLEKSTPSIEVEIEAASPLAVLEMVNVRNGLRKIFPEFQLGNKTKQRRGADFADEFRSGFYARVYRFCRSRPRFTVIFTILTIVASLASIISLFR